MRSIGLGFAHSIIAYSSVMKGLGKVEINAEQLDADLDASQVSAFRRCPSPWLASV